ncbi:MAG: hypothetical protein KTR24_16725 [Saprospiraceae bacterium]|nr:hypothetical protein [Saprospiraceae bacterium]
MKSWILAAIIIVGASWLMLPWVWWIFALPALAVGFAFAAKLRYPFLLGLCAVAVLHLMLVLPQSYANDHMLLDRVSQMFDIPGWGLLAITVIVPALLGGLASWSGASLGKAIRKEKVK